MTNGKMMNGIHSYQQLLQRFEPRPITTEDQYDVVVEQINGLLDKPELTLAEQEMLTLLGTLVLTYEDEHYPDEKFVLRGLDLLKSLIIENGLKEDDLLPIFSTKTTITRVLGGEQHPTSDQINKLATFFGLSKALFDFTNSREFV